MQFKPNKKLGQNFLVDPNLQRKIAAACNLQQADIVLEIGAGRGELTKLIAKSAGFVYAVEIDRCLAGIAKSNLCEYKTVQIINQDILKVNLTELAAKSKRKLRVIGNIPYNITTPIIGHLFKYRNNIEIAYLTVQKEFAKRIVAQPGSDDYGSFSCFVQYYTYPKMLFFIKKGCFFPKPKVDSALVQLSLKRVTVLNLKKEKRLFRIIRAAFNQRRKTLRNSLEGIISDKQLEKFFKKYSLDRNIRPEMLSLQDFHRLETIK